MRYVMVLGVAALLSCGADDGDVCGELGGERFVRCSEGLFCDYSQDSNPSRGVCAPMLALGDECVYESADQCGDSALGHPVCEGGCPYGLICNRAVEPSICAKPLAEGEACELVHHCAAGLTCMSSAEGYDCVHHMGGAGLGQCVSRLALGEACRCDRQCASEICDAGPVGCACAEVAGPNHTGWGCASDEGVRTTPKE